MSLTSLGEFLGDDAPEGIPGIAGRFDGNHILVPLLTAEVPALTDQLKIATTLARATGAALSVINPVTVPEQTPRTLGGAASDATDDALLNWVFDQAADSTPQLDGDFLHTRNVVTGVLRTVRANDVDTLVLPSRSRSPRLRKGVVERIAVHADCDVVVVNGQPGYEQVPSILLPVAGGPHSGFAADLAQAVAADCDAWVDILHVVDEDVSTRRRDAATELVDDVYHRIGRLETTTTWILEADDVADAIIEQSRYYGLTIIGAPTKGRLRQFIFGSTNRSVRTNAGSVVLSVRNNSHRSTAGD
ncbi:universal stress protein [Haloplanus aerogenes]|uniref:Nucleotide-binding universal stress UspA family protein n=1 Tax=Haloplanus aerogenes TaxID=660522 RepID=A0A3M0D8X0_9EURY|nr:universal stress protein [Haloplanus aerogenes]AZH26340.1 universal stress protein [Haloplanus aerogenes]RMB18201.1 nucleotide-binding universal stress UspA family protein [Haloplanus aerogenes]